ncbi:transport and Golgi organization protein 2 [Tenacibaculum adriaticum]|uniref:Transport and Golgi organization protein 2 n=1 Tax=Tenacibaculum adriaticum TaxID=413713 RepID=A0A5S5DY51_9FLAO|nr:NRDE family protein [Tenacibaculum adriaticum]TYP99529.1 transport and Golgi organization protein 2 [Tenacibaculum adriaticum]
MCTVTYLPLGGNDFILTSNRDENPKRKTIPPIKYKENGVELIYPKDEIAGGTWIGLSEKKRLICLLNGGFEKHKRDTSYRLSRGVIVKQLLQVNNPIEIIEHFDFEGIEPFTIVLVDWKNTLKAYELVWDGNQKHFSRLSQEPKIWSSSTLYTEEMKKLRQDWFADWLNSDPEFSQENILSFHQDTKKGNKEVSLKMKRSYAETVSITSVQKSSEKVSIKYIDFVNDTLLKLENVLS